MGGGGSPLQDPLPSSLLFLHHFQHKCTVDLQPTIVRNKKTMWDLAVKNGGNWDRETAAAAAKSLQSCPTLYDPIDSSPPGSPVSGILQARTLERVAISFSWILSVHLNLNILAAASAKSLQLCPTLCDPRDGSPPGSPVPGILQARVGCHFLLQCMKVKSESEVAQSCLTLSDPMDCSLPGYPWDFPGKSTGVGCHCLLCYNFYFFLFSTVA